MADIRSLINDIPPVTRFLLISTALVTFPCLLALIDPAQVYLSWPRALYRYELYRPLTAFFYAGSGYPLIYDFFLIYRNSMALEVGTYGGRTGEYAWARLVIAGIILLVNLLPPFGHPFLFRPFLHAENYLWCRANPTMKMSLFGLLEVPVPYYPAALVVLDLITGGTQKALGGLMGMCAGHVWWYLSTYLPSHPSPSIRRPNPLRMPAPFARLFSNPPGAGQFSGTGFTAQPGGNFAARAAAAAAAEGRSTGSSTAVDGSAGGASHRWGRSGNRLGGEPL